MKDQIKDSATAVAEEAKEEVQAGRGGAREVIG